MTQNKCLWNIKIVNYLKYILELIPLAIILTERIWTMFTICTIKKHCSQLLASTSASLQSELSFLNDRAPLNRRWIKSNFLKSRNPPIQKALLSQRDIRMSSTYSELYTKTMYKSIEKKGLLLYFSLFALNKYLVLWTLTIMRNLRQHYDMLTALPGVTVQCWLNVNYMWSNNTPSNDLWEIYSIQ